MAVSAARSKIAPLPSAVAFWEAVLNTFSKTRGTASTKVGWNWPRSRTRLVMSALWPSRTRAFTAPTWMTRANTWASGRKSSVAESSGENSSSSSSTATPTSVIRLPWVIMQPLGGPVVPEV